MRYYTDWPKAKACLDVEPLQQLITYANAQGLDCLVEVHNQKELDEIKDITGKIAIGVNNRDLHTFHTDTATAEQLLPVIRDYFPVAPAVAESGYLNVADLDRLSEIGFNAVLIGEGLAKNPDLLNWFISWKLRSVASRIRKMHSMRYRWELMPLGLFLQKTVPER